MERILDTSTDVKANVLLVDDEEDFAKAYIPLWERSSGLKFVYARDAKTARELLEKNPIKVAVIDYVMPTSGFELRKQLLEIDPRLKTILLSGEMKEHMVQAQREGFDYVMMKSEKDLDELPQVVLRMISKYNNDLKTRTCAKIGEVYAVSKRGWFFRSGCKITYTIVDYSTIEEERVVGKWHTQVLIRAGQELTSESEIDIEREFQSAIDFKIENESGLSFSEKALFDFKSSLALKMEAAFDIKYTEKVKQVFKQTNKYRLAEDSPDVVSRSFEYAKMARVMRVYVKKECSCCGEAVVVPLTVYLPIPVIKYRIVEHYKDNKKNEIDSGEFR